MRFVVTLVVIMLVVLAVLYGVGVVRFDSLLGLSSQGRVAVVGMKFPLLEIPKWHCSLYMNSTHIVRVCWAIRYPYELTLRSGENISDTEFRSRYGFFPEVNHTIIEVMNLEKRYAYKYEIYNFTNSRAIGYTKLDYNETFTYKWVDITRMYNDINSLSNHYVIKSFNGTGFTFYIAPFIYYKANNTLVPAPHSVGEAIARIIREWYTSILENITGIPYRVVVVNPQQYCDFSEHPKGAVPSTVADYISCRSINKLHILRTVIVVSHEPLHPTLINREVNGLADVEAVYVQVEPGTNITRTISVFILVHEFGHELGLPDLYKEDHSWWTGIEWSIARCSFMDNQKCDYDSLSLADLAILMWTTYMEIYTGNRVLCPVFEERLLTYGINVSWNGVKILLPVTSDNDIPEPFKYILEKGIVEYNGEKIIHRPELLEAMKIITRYAP